MMKGWLSPKTMKFTELNVAIADDYRNGVGVKELEYKYGRSRTWIYHVIYCYGLAPRTKLTEARDPLNYHRLKRHLKRKELSNNGRKEAENRIHDAKGDGEAPRDRLPIVV